MSFIEKYYKLEKKLFEEEKYKDVKLNSKVAYAILKYMVENNINIKIDKDGKKYIENSREYIKQKMNLSINTITSIYKEIIKLDLIEEKWIEVGKPNIVYIKNCESEETEEKHNICEIAKVEKIKEEKEEIIGEFNYADYMVAKYWLEEIELKKINFLYNICLKKIDLDRYTHIEQDIIKIALQYITGKKEPSTFDKDINNIDNETLSNVIKDIKNKTRDEINSVIESLVNELPIKCFRKCRKM